MYGVTDKVIPTEPVPMARPFYENQPRQNLNIQNSSDNRMVIFKPKNMQV